MQDRSETRRRAEIVEKNNAFDKGRDTGKTAHEYCGDLLLEMRSKDSPDLLWTQKVQSRSGHTFYQDINDQTMRKDMIENLSRRMGDLDVPIFIPTDSNISPLPIVAD